MNENGHPDDHPRQHLSGERNRHTPNPNIRGTPEWHAWEGGYRAARADAGRAIAKIKDHLGARRSNFSLGQDVD